MPTSTSTGTSVHTTSMNTLCVVFVVCPGLADTPMKVGFTGRSGDPAEAAANEAKIVSAVPMGRLVKPGEVADAVLWMVSDEASFVTGVALPVDGGFTAR